MSTSAFAPRALPRRFRHSSRELGPVAWQTLAGLLVAGATAAFVIYLVHHLNLKGVAAGLVVAGSLWFFTARKPQLALALLMLYLGLLDGYLKLATGSTVVTFVRDAFLWALAIGLLLRAIVTRQPLPVPPLSGWLIAFTVIVLVEFANPNAGTIRHSLGGAREHLEFIPLFFLTYAYVRTVRALRIFCILLAVIAAANGIAGWVQFKESPAQFAAWGPGYSERVLGTGAFEGAGRSAAIGTNTSTRPFGLGSDAGDGGLFGMVALCGILVLAAFSQRRRYQLFAVAMAIAAVLGIVTSQGKSVIIGSIVTVLAFALLTVTGRNRLRSFSGLALAVFVAVIVVASVVGQVGSGGFRYSGLAPSSIVTTTAHERGFAFAAIPHNIVTYPFGTGLGSAGPDSGAAGASQLTLTGNLDAENEFAFLTLEGGVPGLFVFIAFALTLIVVGFRRVRHEPDRQARVLLAALIAPLAAIFAQFFVTAASPTVPVGPYIFAVGGIISYWLISLPAQRAREARSAQLEPAAGPGGTNLTLEPAA
jgi:hypothetical protein